MENELDLHTDQKNHSDESAQSALETKKPSRKSRDSSLFSEQDLRDQHEVDSTEEHEDDQQTDYSKLNKPQLIAAAKELSKEASFGRIDALLKELKPLIEEIQSQERASARERFQADGGALDDFEYLGDHLDHEFDALVKLHRDRKQKYFQELEQQKTENLDRKNMVLEKLRA
ncbi:MAG: DUF349 domain-containing protein, partial [Cyclobacteriaceae bacterium]|nr:DUF349 domain-containing protein [Cyclobacteriaceae bacterium]